MQQLKYGRTTTSSLKSSEGPGHTTRIAHTLLEDLRALAEVLLLVFRPEQRDEEAQVRRVHRTPQSLPSRNVASLRRKATIAQSA